MITCWVISPSLAGNSIPDGVQISVRFHYEPGFGEFHNPNIFNVANVISPSQHLDRGTRLNHGYVQNHYRHIC